MDASIIIRTYNEATWLPAALDAVAAQTPPPGGVETIVVDSGSTDATRAIAEAHGCRIVPIAKEDFSFGRSLNLGCAAAQGEALVFLSGHCIPEGGDWLTRLIAPLGRDRIAYTYGRQVGHERSKYSETRLFAKYFPAASALPQDGFFCNNANAALLRSVWAEHRFDEQLTGLEDMDLAKRLLAAGARVGYVADAAATHIHEESWHKVRTRYEREAVALQGIMPEVQVGLGDVVRYFFSAVFLDWAQAVQDRVFWHTAGEVVLFRLMQYWGTYRGNNEHRKLSARRRDAYFYPR
ncbi:glycosyl transferase family 2 [Rhodothalassium salexigens]|uniref:glycosyltransferase family 2 protein n=1 Tax=Rhodothalassium salexigens TaxID=1086 RepID=UPI001912B291|nr:glycosyltransferase family 2 protein [Rhodothalassium salexigens]MBK5910299.1 glycosyl transferase family 2 [Rhodothalassium salexigens]MBK5921088.1 glycosyl transferase family 2 [Rhodothalassium salexigens]